MQGSFVRGFRRFFSVSSYSHRKKRNRLIPKGKRVLKGKYFPFTCRETTHRPEKKFQTKHFIFPLYAAPLLKTHRTRDTALARLCRHPVSFTRPLGSDTLAQN